jgi:hypothetical protein
MPQVEVPKDGRVEIIANPAAFSSYAVNHISGPRVFIAHTPSQTREQGQIIDEGDRTVLRNLNREPVYAKTPAGASNPAIIDVRKTGFLLQYAPRKSVTVDGSVDIGAATIDQFNATAPVDITAQSLGNLAQDVTVESSRSVTEVNADQTSDLSPSTIQDTTVRAGSGEVWTLLKARLRASSTDIFGATSGTHRFIVETEAEGIELARGESTYDETVEWQYGKWVQANSEAQGDLRDVQLDESNGIRIQYVNDTNATQTNSRIIRFQFEVKQVA